LFFLLNAILVGLLPYLGYDSVYIKLKSIKMKNLSKIAGYTVATILAFILTQSQVLAANGPAGNESSLSGAQVIGGFAVLLLVILIPIMRSSKKANLNR
jgi:hypothetical protein